MKKQTNEVSIIRDITKADNGIIYRYVLFCEKSEKVASFSIPLYSIEVSMTKDGELTSNVAKELFADVGKAVAFSKSSRTIWQRLSTFRTLSKTESRFKAFTKNPTVAFLYAPSDFFLIIFFANFLAKLIHLCAIYLIGYIKFHTTE